ncbi:4Fe4S-binding leucine-rich repeat protein [Paraburkholderia caballeronis]|uniref:4Fe4S-binding leucine-rich repeat protein n=1 Tax=Paraburkholderia caballeronis TaxID=416943 RepID=UPI001065BE65|nr:4Fe4S-binding leucine-rich repeat protein [Paraburkholderia caballeronis]TDV15755.1 leucine rich repeat (LRR) protein [Paraburkholderia caballeronis]TDV18010.1 leucine rich repeat (LRR) protein [Paraburkholderia caballeronis]TDV26376.1 leucine rich repeat (LRR) protein [Paraburkholderia caballeronis]
MNARRAARAPFGDIPPRHWQGGPVDCASCEHHALRARPDETGCEPGHACMQDAYARRIDRFFRWHPELGNAHLDHRYFEVRAIAARHADVFRLPALIDDPDETVRLQIALRLPHAHLARMAGDPHREVRMRVAQRLDAAALAHLRTDPDYGVREWVARRLPSALLPLMASDADRAVRMRVAERIDMPALLRMADDPEAEVRRIVATRLPAALVMRFFDDPDWRVRWEAARRAQPHALTPLLADPDDEVRAMARERSEAQRIESPCIVGPCGGEERPFAGASHG